MIAHKNVINYIIENVRKDHIPERLSGFHESPPKQNGSRKCELFCWMGKGRRVTHLEDRRNTFRQYLVDGAEFAGRFEFPKLRQTRYIPEAMIPFHMIRRRKPMRGAAAHFFIEDYQFERLWNAPGRYLDALKNCGGVIAPDFSMYAHMSRAQRIWNCYRSRALSYWMQRQGLDVVPVIEWGEKEDLAWCLDGIPRCGTVAIGLYGCRRDAWARYSLLHGFAAACEMLEPYAVLAYGARIPEMESLCRHIRWYPNYCEEMKKRL